MFGCHKVVSRQFGTFNIRLSVLVFIFLLCLNGLGALPENTSTRHQYNMGLIYALVILPKGEHEKFADQRFHSSFPLCQLLVYTLARLERGFFHC